MSSNKSKEPIQVCVKYDIFMDLCVKSIVTRNPKLLMDAIVKKLHARSLSLLCKDCTSDALDLAWVCYCGLNECRFVNFVDSHNFGVSRNAQWNLKLVCTFKIARDRKRTEVLFHGKDEVSVVFVPCQEQH